MEVVAAAVGLRRGYHRHKSFLIERPSYYGRRGSDRRGITSIVLPNWAALGPLPCRIGLVSVRTRSSQWISRR